MRGQEKFDGHAYPADELHGQSSEIQKAAKSGSGHGEAGANGDAGHHVQQCHHGGPVRAPQRPEATAAAASAPGAGAGGQNLDMAMVVADGSKKGRADPAYDAHSLPIGEWAMAVWERWTTRVSMQKVIDDAVERTTRATNKWSVCYGPGAAFCLNMCQAKLDHHVSYQGGH